MIFPSQDGYEEKGGASLLGHVASEKKVDSNGWWANKTMFSPCWRPEKITEKILESLRNFIGVPEFERGAFVVKSFTDCGIEIRTVIRNGLFITSYPIEGN